MTMVEPAVLNLMADWLRQVSVLPAAKGPRARVQPARNGTMASPVRLPMVLQAAGRPVTHAEGAGPVLVVEQLVVVVDEVVVVGAVVVVVDELLEVVVLLVVDVGVVALEVLEVVEEVVLLVVDAGVAVTEVVAELLLLSPLVDVGPAVEDEHPPLGSPRPMEVRRHDSTFKGSVTAVVRHCATAPMAKGPRAVVHCVTLTGICAIDEVGMSRHAWGRPVMQTLVMAARRHATMLAPEVETPICPAKQAAVWAVPTVARVAAHRGTRGIRARPLVSPRAVQGAARSVAQTGVRGVGTQELVVVEEEVVEVLGVSLLAGLVVVPPLLLLESVLAPVVVEPVDDEVPLEVVLVGVLLVEPPPDVLEQAVDGSPRPIELRRQVKMARGLSIVCFRQSRAAPTANGPRAAVQEMRSWGSWPTGSVPRARQAAGRSVMQMLGMAAWRQATRPAPLVPTPMLADRHAPAWPPAKAPRAVVQSGTRGVRAKPLAPPRAWHACGRVLAQTEGSAEVQLVVDEELVVVVDEVSVAVVVVVAALEEDEVSVLLPVEEVSVDEVSVLLPVEEVPVDEVSVLLPVLVVSVDVEEAVVSVEVPVPVLPEVDVALLSVELPVPVLLDVDVAEVSVELPVLVLPEVDVAEVSVELPVPEVDAVVDPVELPVLVLPPVLLPVPVELPVSVEVGVLPVPVVVVPPPPVDWLVGQTVLGNNV